MAFSGEAASPLPFPIIADHNRELSVLLGMLDPDELDKDGIPLTARCVSPASSSRAQSCVGVSTQMYAGLSACHKGARTWTNFDV